MTRRLLKITAVFVIGMIGGIFADQILWPYFIERPLFYQYGLEQSPVYLTERKEITIEENVALQNAIERAEKVVLGIETKNLAGSGLIVTADGFAVTLAELVPKYSTSTLFIGEKEFFPQVLKRDTQENLALLKIDSDNLSTLGFADLENLKIGQRVFLLGFSGVANEGIVRSFDEKVIETNISEEKGLKGSILFNIKGEVLGINEISSQGKVSAIPCSKIKELIGM